MAWETVATFDNPITAEMARNYLEEHGVEAMLGDQETVATVWQLSNAVGGVKLLVPARDLILAEQLLREREDETPHRREPQTAVAANPEAARHAAHPGPEEPFDDSEADKVAERAVKAMVLGLIIWPLQPYAMFVLLQIPSAGGPLKPRSWRKIYLALAVCMPLWAVVGVPLVMMLGTFADPLAPHWHVELIEFGQHSVAADFPNPEGRQGADVNLPTGPLRGHSYDAFAGMQSFSVLVWPTGGRLPEDEDVLAYVRARIEQVHGKLESFKGIEHNRFLGVEYRAFSPDRGWLRGQAFAVGDHLVELVTAGPEEARENSWARRFFRSLRIH